MRLPSDNPVRSAAFLDAAPARGGADDARRSWVYRHVLAAVRDGVLAPGERLPSSRRLALAWGVARGAVDDALARLASEGLLVRRVGRGSFVAQRLPASLRGSLGLAAGPREALQELAPLLHFTPPHPWRHHGVPQPGATTLSPRVPDLKRFPLALWRRQLARALGDDERASLAYGAPAGVPQLRQAIARHLALTRGLACDAEQVFVLNGPMHTMDLISRVLLEPGDCVLVERPGHLNVGRTVVMSHLDLRVARVDEEGFDVTDARRVAPRPALLYVHPLNQWPTGVVMSAARRRALLQWAAECGAWIVEGDHNGEIVHDGAAPAPLLATEGGQRVLFLGTFNGVMFPALRISYLVVPERLVGAFAAVRGMLGDHPPTATQQALAGFLDEGHLGAHLRLMRGLYRARRDALREAAQQHLLPRAATLGPMRGAMHGCIYLKSGTDDVALVQRLAPLGYGVQPLSIYSWPAPGRPGLLVGYGADEAEDIPAATRRLGEVLQTAPRVLRAPPERGLALGGSMP
jgi:GntR family transcriptional regulator/MocR family aminotransferase